MRVDVFQALGVSAEPFEAKRSMGLPAIDALTRRSLLRSGSVDPVRTPRLATRVDFLSKTPGFLLREAAVADDGLEPQRSQEPEEYLPG